MSEMILVKSVNVSLVPSEVVEILHPRPEPWSGKRPDTESFDREVVEGEVFHTAGGKRICLGMTRQVREVLGLPLGIFESQQERIRNLEDYTNKLKHNLRRLTLWQRIKILFGADPVKVCQ